MRLSMHPCIPGFLVCSSDHSELRKRPRRRRQRRAGPRALVVHLAHSARRRRISVHRDEGNKGESASPVKVALKVEQEHFQQRRAIVEGRAAPKRRRRRDVLRRGRPAPRRCMLERGILVEADVGGRVAEIAAAFLAMDDRDRQNRDRRASRWRRRSPSPSAIRIAGGDRQSSISSRPRRQPRCPAGGLR